MERLLIFCAFFLTQQIFGIAEATSTASCNKIILEASDQENLTLSSTTLKGSQGEDSNSIWRAKGFSVQRMDELLTQIPAMTAFPSELLASSYLPRNSSRIFHSSDDTARLSITIKEFKHGSMYLNFSYYVGLKSRNLTNPVKESNYVEKSGSKANVHEGIEEDLRESGGHHQHRHRHHRHHSNTDVVSAIAHKAKQESKQRVKRDKSGNGKSQGKSKRFSAGPDDKDKNLEDISEEYFAHEGGKKKVPYQLWKASLQNKYRPPGFYISVNDEVVFDHWEGIWNKDFVIGKWTGSYTSRLTRGLWNHTEILINWENMPTNDVKISFEWEAVNENSFVAISDIVLSTSTDSTSCSEQSTSPPKHSPAPTSSVKHGNNLAFLFTPLEVQVENQTADSQLSQILVTKHGGAWKIFGVGKVKSAESGGEVMRAKLLREIDNEKDIPKSLMEELERSGIVQSVPLDKKGNGSMQTSEPASASTSLSMTTKKLSTVATATTFQTTSTATVMTTSTESTPTTTTPTTATATSATTSAITTTTASQQLPDPVRPVRIESSQEQRDKDGERTLVLCVGAVGLFVGLSIIRYKLNLEEKREREANQYRTQTV